ncbi:hypothetical protein, partial [Tolypothrix sp. VBCCA 56010]|uniref:hypothetical protein n=1 Tax=Tolypothrix sp. VBCCA 56010 TaxID=3137731 RepID=UPI003D7EC64E
CSTWSDTKTLRVRQSPIDGNRARRGLPHRTASPMTAGASTEGTSARHCLPNAQLPITNYQCPSPACLYTIDFHILRFWLISPRLYNKMLKLKMIGVKHALTG